MVPYMASPVVINGSARIKPGRRDALKDCLALQRLLRDLALSLREDVAPEIAEIRARKATAVAAAAKGWETLEDRKRILRGRPLPGSLRPEKEPPARKRKTLISLSEPETIALSPGSPDLSLIAPPPPPYE